MIIVNITSNIDCVLNQLLRIPEKTLFHFVKGELGHTQTLNKRTTLLLYKSDYAK